MKKRRNEGSQETKDEYEARQHRVEVEGGGESNPGIGFSRASTDILKSRRIIRVSNSSRFAKRGRGGATGSGTGIGGSALPAPSGGGNMVSPTAFGGAISSIPTPKAAPTTATTPSSKNPFASTVLTPAPQTNNNNEATKSNPFASISFASSTKSQPAKSSAPTASTPGFKFNPSNMTKRSKPSTPAVTSSGSSSSSIPPFSFSKPNTSATSTSTSNSPLLPLRNGAKQNDTIPFSKATQLNIEMLRMAQMEHKANPLSNWTCWMKKYTNDVQELKNGTVDDQEEHGEVDKVVEEKSSSATPAFSFGSKPTTSPTTKPFTGFAMDPEAAPATITNDKTSSFSGFSFASSTPTPAPVPAVPAPAPAPTTVTPSETPNDTSASNSDQVIKTVNEDDEELYECRAKYRKFIDESKEWKTYSAGILRLTKSKSKGTCQIVIRDATVGKVQFNVGVAKNMVFQEPKISKGKGSILFIATQDLKRGPEKFILVAKDVDSNGLYAKLKTITN